MTPAKILDEKQQSFLNYIWNLNKNRYEPLVL